MKPLYGLVMAASAVLSGCGLMGIEERFTQMEVKVEKAEGDLKEALDLLRNYKTQFGIYSKEQLRLLYGARGDIQHLNKFLFNIGIHAGQIDQKLGTLDKKVDRLLKFHEEIFEPSLEQELKPDHESDPKSF